MIKLYDSAFSPFARKVRMVGRVSEKVSHGSGSVVLLRATAKGGQWLA